MRQWELERVKQSKARRAREGERVVREGEQVRQCTGVREGEVNECA